MYIMQRRNVHYNVHLMYNWRYILKYIDNVHYNVHLKYMYCTCKVHLMHNYYVHKMYIIMYIMQKHNAHVM
jgi:hypothetical protein